MDCKLPIKLVTSRAQAKIPKAELVTQKIVKILETNDKLCAAAD